jgi:hypothetical protein
MVTREMMAMRVLREPWPWSDLDRTAGRWALFVRSAESLTTCFLWAYAVVLWWPGSTFAISKAFAWLILASGGNELPWSVAAFALGVIAPLAVGMDDGRLRILSLVSQGAFFGFLGLSFAVNSPLGLGWVTFALSGAWLLWRGLGLMWQHARR